jgi:hypothetical protein
LLLLLLLQGNIGQPHGLNTTASFLFVIERTRRFVSRMCSSRVNNGLTVIDIHVLVSGQRRSSDRPLIVS